MVTLKDNCIIKFEADWCGPCKALTPVVDKVAAELDVEVIKVNVDTEKEFAAQYGVKNIPMLVAIKDGKPAADGVLVGNKGEQAVRDFFQKVK